MSGSLTCNGGGGPAGSLIRAQCPLRLFQIRFHHFDNQVFPGNLMLPAQPPVCLGRIAHQAGYIGWAKEFRINFDPFPIIQSQMRKGNFTELAHGMAFSGGDYIIVRLRLVQQSPHGLYILPGMAPITLGLEVAQAEFLAQAEFDTSQLRGNFSSHKLNAAAWRLVIEKNAAAYKQVICLAVILTKLKSRNFGNGVSRARM